MWLFRYLFTNLYRAIQTANGRRLLWLFLRYAGRPRHQPARSRVKAPLAIATGSSIDSVQATPRTKPTERVTR